MTTRLALVLSALALLLVLLPSACGSDPATPTEIHVTSFAFTPATLTIKAGTTVRWINDSTVDHTVTSGTSLDATDLGAIFDHNPLHPGDTLDVTFTSAGATPYLCRFHGSMGMKGTITVTN